MSQNTADQEKPALLFGKLRMSKTRSFDKTTMSAEPVPDDGERAPLRGEEGCDCSLQWRTRTLPRWARRLHWKDWQEAGTFFQSFLREARANQTGGTAGTEIPP